MLGSRARSNECREAKLPRRCGKRRCLEGSLVSEPAYGREGIRGGWRAACSAQSDWRLAARSRCAACGPPTFLSPSLHNRRGRGSGSREATKNLAATLLCVGTRLESSRGATLIVARVTRATSHAVRFGVRTIPGVLASRSPWVAIAFFRRPLVSAFAGVTPPGLPLCPGSLAEVFRLLVSLIAGLIRLSFCRVNL